MVVVHTVLLDPLPKGLGHFSHVCRATPIYLAFPVIDNILLLFIGDLVFGRHQQRLEGVYPLKTNLYGHVFEDLQIHTHIGLLF